MLEHLKGLTTLVVIVAGCASVMVWAMTQFVDLAETLIARYTEVIEFRQAVTCQHVEALEKRHFDIDPKLDCEALDLNFKP